MTTGRYWTLGLLGCAMIGVSIAVVAWLAFGFGQIGACSTAGHIRGRPVPECSTDSALRIVGIFPAVLLGLAGMLIAGRRVPRARRTRTVGLTTWVVGYWVVGAALIASGLDRSTQAAGPDRIGWMIPGFVFIPLGFGGLLYALVTRRSAAHAEHLRRHGAQAAATVPGVPDPTRPHRLTASIHPGGPATAPEDIADDLERLARLRDAGDLTPAEFEAAKARMLRG